MAKINTDRRVFHFSGGQSSAMMVSDSDTDFLKIKLPQSERLYQKLKKHKAFAGVKRRYIK